MLPRREMRCPSNQSDDVALLRGQRVLGAPDGWEKLDDESNPGEPPQEASHHADPAAVEGRDAARFPVERVADPV